MARSRNIKPGLFTNEILGTVDPYLTLLFEGLWCEADKEGRLEDRPLKINVKVFPYRNFTLKKIDGLLNELTALGFITRYQVSGAAIIQVVNFRKHQAPHSTEKESVLPEEPVAEVSQNQSVSEVTEVVALPNASLTEVVALPNASSTEVEESGIRNQESGIRNQESG
ncbi:MAG: hypothetical protein ABI878_13870, partial [Acidobacteriota bacterium]